MPTNEAAAIYCQLLHALIAANVLFYFVNNPEVHKLFKVLQPSNILPSRKWISINQVHKEVELEIKHLLLRNKAKYLTLTEDRWTNVSQHSSFEVLHLEIIS
ncbi:hypothetical protein GLOIN_2v1884236 [Rhizophagus irregularis DAOM 181602=DAOM 197198]|uniref:Uncharacterized protein n=1 Tax=Rhizophagus irregularis (strain DAOM 181602 / DAOM 197198 / MUCL 43194) TaxID=747089 RepID=A0A2P4P5A0_RHIID|nr:hypothetical protein GLOIN_2v1884236 [Rhizophagus irregularis DAOM 181602=DAOM 197198]POG60568.1 hypothetical protein GLOIN_2v1884236 [Rhizophagus irregularis DAOM 181602=DAOM 197198]GBC34408.2 hypothetical protein GLOIN_2v1884236 [Rhizophagus irregularis DAOM 181602=DAOM 197198]|eukprot:XP_025167434.1 hypothetical protein GLOIN_2v1884236 [Rhizophagus irregularis DAOM 181602=DAOM 197198]